MNLYQITSTNRNGVLYEYWIYAEKMEFSPVGRGVQFYKDEQVVFVVDNFVYAHLRNEEYIYEKCKFHYEGYSKEEIIKMVISRENETYLKYCH